MLQKRGKREKERGRQRGTEGEREREREGDGEGLRERESCESQGPNQGGGRLVRLWGNTVERQRDLSM